MALIKLPRDAFDTYTVTARPTRTFSSSSSGVTGSVRVYRQASSTEKVSTPFSEDFQESSIEELLLAAQSVTGTDRSTEVSKYLDAVNSADSTARGTKSMEVLRFTPSFTLTSDTLRKNVVKEVLYPYYRGEYQRLDWSYTNYLSLHFPDSVGPTSASLIYPSPSASYIPTSDFTIEFYVKPNYTSASGSEYHAATIMHASSSFAVSLVSGSSRDLEGRPSSFRVLLQLTHSADVAPSLIDTSVSNNSRSYPSDLVFLSEDDFILHNQWHHVALRWSPTVNDGTGSFYIDNYPAGQFTVPSSSVTPAADSSTLPEGLLIGNYVAGASTALNNLTGYFNESAITNEGVSDALNTVGDPSAIEPSSFSLTHPFRGELHEIRIWSVIRDDEQVYSGSVEGSGDTDGLLFYLPPFFVRETPNRSVLQTPFQSLNTTTDDPFNVAMSFGVGGHLINTENHVREFVRGYYPRLLHLTASTLDSQTLENLEANEYLYATGSIVRRNLTILPNDNGKFYPNFDLLVSGSSFDVGTPNEKFKNSLGGQDITSVSLEDLVPTSSLFPGLIPDNSLVDAVAGASPENPGVAPGSVLTIFQRTRDPSSNMVTFFDASNLFYGSSIHPGTYELTDNSVSGSGGSLSITLKDNGRGVLYRADADSPHATWSRVGSVIYPEGIATVLSPYLGELYGKDSFTVSFKGEQQVHILETQAVAPAWTLNTSSNPSWSPLYSSDYANDENKGFVYINTLNFHDDNLNVVARANLSQPIVKRPNDRIMFRVKFDF